MSDTMCIHHQAHQSLASLSQVPRPFKGPFGLLTIHATPHAPYVHKV